MKPGALVRLNLNAGINALWGYPCLEPLSDWKDLVLLLHRRDVGAVVASTNDISKHWRICRWFLVLSRHAVGWVREGDVVEL